MGIFDIFKKKKTEPFSDLKEEDFEAVLEGLTGWLGVNFRVNEELHITYSADGKKDHTDIDFFAQLYDFTIYVLNHESDMAAKAEKDKTIKEYAMKQKNIDFCFTTFIEIRFKIPAKHHSLIIKNVRQKLKTLPESTLYKK